MFISICSVCETMLYNWVYRNKKVLIYACLAHKNVEVKITVHFHIEKHSNSHGMKVKTVIEFKCMEKRSDLENRYLLVIFSFDGLDVVFKHNPFLAGSLILSYKLSRQNMCFLLKLQ